MTHSEDATSDEMENNNRKGAGRTGFLGPENSLFRDVITILTFVIAAAALLLSFFVYQQDSEANRFAMTAEAESKTADIQPVTRIGDSVGFESDVDRAILGASGLSALFASTDCAAALHEKDPGGESFDYLYLTLRNLGPGSARDLGFSDFEVLSDNPRSDAGCLRPLAQVPFLQTDQFYAVLLAAIPESGRISGIEELPFIEINFTVEYDDELGEHHVQAGAILAEDIIEGRVVPEAVSPQYFER